MICQQLIHSNTVKFTELELNNILALIDEKNSSTKVKISRKKLSECEPWFYDEQNGEIRNKNRAFFQIKGLRCFKDDKLELEQPIIIQNEIGYLGIICKEIDGVLKFLTQLKIEPGNVNKIQISPTIQATKSNFTQKHGGKRPAYLDYFLNAEKYEIIVDQIQSEQSSRFLGKRNRNIIIKIDEEIETLPSHLWLSLGQIKQLLRYDNLINMDARTVLSCIPYSSYALSDDEKSEIYDLFTDKSLFESMFSQEDHKDFIRVYNYINNYKMLRSGVTKLVPLKSLNLWNFSDDEIRHKESYPFKVIFCDIEIEGREVTHWSQPLFEAEGEAVFGLICANFNGKKKFLTQAKPEAGCFDVIELAPTVQLEAGISYENYNEIDKLFFKLCKDNRYIKNDVVLSEEGGRFYCEQNRNIILEIENDLISDLPQGYFWLDYRTLNKMEQFNNCLNIQLRNLLSLLEV